MLPLSYSFSAREEALRCKTVSLVCCSYSTLSNRKTIKNSRLVSQKDDVHVCIMCLRAVMNYQVQKTDTTRCCLCAQWITKSLLQCTKNKYINK